MNLWSLVPVAFRPKDQRLAAYQRAYARERERIAYTSRELAQRYGLADSDVHRLSVIQQEEMAQRRLRRKYRL